MLKKNKIAGVDEVGRGCLAGPVFSAAVILNKNINKKNITDSKIIPFKKRILLADYIKKNSIYAIGISSVREIDKINILNASLLSMKRALTKLKALSGSFFNSSNELPFTILFTNLDISRFNFTLN